MGKDEEIGLGREEKGGREGGVGGEGTQTPFINLGPRNGNAFSNDLRKIGRTKVCVG